MRLTQPHHRFFQTFGYLAFPGLMADVIDAITTAFEEVIAPRGGDAHDGALRTCFVPFIDQHPLLSALLDDPCIEGILAGLLGEDFNYLGSDGNYYAGDTSWHPDGNYPETWAVKIAFYLDPLTRDTGCLRVISGSHVPGSPLKRDLDAAGDLAACYGVPQSELPCVALETQPGDVVVFDHNLRHASFGGGARRRMFTINAGRRCVTPEEIERLEGYIRGHARFHLQRMHGVVMRETAGPSRWRHLQQVIDHEGVLPLATAAYIAAGGAPARG
ncbi:MAG: phytanoyl-CoA dioxygenase family protein [Armatimonadetes bacterium]|nr:phytanoyl-CoA dioxygenase family protein [Armatimonadota bacterium]